MKIISFIVVSLSMFTLGCDGDPSAFKIPFPEPVIEDKSGTINSYNPEVDILFLIDDSGSMGSYQARLAANSDIFIRQFFNAKFIDFHIGVTTSTESGPFGGGFGSKAANGRLHQIGSHKYVERATPDGEMVLADMLNVGASGSGTEKFLTIPELTFKTHLDGFNKGFYRPNAHLVIFILTDTFDQTRLEPEDTYDFLLKLKNDDASKLHFAGALVSIQKAGCTPDQQNVPVKLQKLAALFQARGHRFNICQSDYGSDLARVATSIVDAVSTVYLDELPNIDTMQVFYGDKRIPNQESGGWTYDYSLNAIHLSPEIDVQGANGDKLNIRYEELYKAPE